MKKITLFGLFFIGLSAFQILDDLTKYKVNIPEFKDKILDLATANSFSGFTYYAPKTVKDFGLKLPASDQASMARAVGLFAKSFVMAGTFKADFENKLNATKQSTDPNAAQWKEEYNYFYEQHLNEANANLSAGVFTDDFFVMNKQMADGIRESLNNPNPYGDTPEGKAQYESELSAFKQTVNDADAIFALKPLLKSNKAEFAKKYASIKAKAELNEKLRSVAEKNKEIDSKKDYKANIKTQLHQFLDESADVDFSAKVSMINGVREFENEEYKRKPAIWKQCYRMGKPATTEFRKIAEEWINEL